MVTGCRILLVAFALGCLSWAARIIIRDMRLRRDLETGRRLAAEAQRRAAQTAVIAAMEEEFAGDARVAWLAAEVAALDEGRRQR